jgi:5-formyltetrahydrofolate cyclo-ligase
MRSAAVRQPSSASFWLKPVAAHLVGLGLRGGAGAQRVGQHGVAAHLRVVAHAKARDGAGEVVPVAALARDQQPVVAQAVFLVAAGVAREEVLHLVRGGLLQARLEFPVGGPRFQGMAAGLGQQGREAGLVAALEGLLHLDQHVVVGVGLCGGGLLRKQCGNGQDRGKNQCGCDVARMGARAVALGCQNAWELHRGIMDKSKDADTSATASFLKDQLRKALIEQRLAMPDRLTRADLLQRVMRIWLVGRPDTVIGAYWPIKGEFDPLPALHRWKEDGELMEESQRRRIGLPVIDKVHKTLTFHAWYPGCQMEEDAYGIPKPKDTELIVPTLLFVPCVGYSAGGYRLGYGGGFYDRTLAALEPRPFTVGLGFTHGFLEDFEPEAHDLPLDAILNDNGVVWPTS